MGATLFRSLLASVAVLAAACSSATKEAPVTPAPTQQADAAPSGPPVTMMHLQAKMRDGARLDTSVWLPATTGKFPVVLTRTPYSSEFGGFQKRLISAGYAVVQQHERGRFLSEGEMRMLGNADEDGWDTLDWIAKQGWSNGKVATLGCSSSAENQLKLATLNHPTHKAMIVGSSGVGIADAGPHHEQGNFWRGGAWQMGWADYFFGEMYLDWPQLAPGLSDEERTKQTAAYKWPEEPGIPTAAFDTARMHLPVIDLAKVMKAPDTELEEYLARGPSNPAWAEDRVTEKDHIKIPGLWAEAAYDISSASGAAFFEKTRRENPSGTQAIVVTNGQHCSFARPRTQIGDRPLGSATFDYNAMALAWLDRWLKDDKSAALPKTPVRAYLAGANRWADLADVPTANTTNARTFFLASNGAANTAAGNGVLADKAPAKAGSDKFAYDPKNPVISHGGQISGVGTDQKDGAFDQREIEKRNDVLVYTSAPLTEDLPVFGFVTADLFVGSDAPDTDFTVKLVDVAPDGTAWNISDTILRMRYRDGMTSAKFMKAGEVYSIAPPPMLTSNVFLKGHAIRIEVSSSNFPTYARNLNTAADLYTTTETRIASNQVLHGPGRLSKIMLPIAKLAD